MCVSGRFMIPPERSVALVGRPNVGKSRLFNRLARRRIAIVHDQPGVTRDLATAEIAKQYTLFDTGGIGMKPEMTPELIHSATEEQVGFAVTAAGLVVFVVDGIEGLTSIDRELAEQFRRSGKPVLLVVNKMDKPSAQKKFNDFYELGFGDPIAVSAEHGEGAEELHAEILDKLGPYKPPFYDKEAKHRRINICLCGKPNVGKSSLGNALLKAPRLIVSEVAGTTRDAIELDLDYKPQAKERAQAEVARQEPTDEGQEAETESQKLKAESQEGEEDSVELPDDSLEPQVLEPETENGEPKTDKPAAGGPLWRFRLMDTAGVKPKRKIGSSLDYFSGLRTEGAIQRADVALLVLDALTGVGKHDKTLAGQILEAGKGLVIVVNKWDLALEKFQQDSLRGYDGEREFRKAFIEAIQTELFFLPESPVLFVSAKSGFRVETLLSAARQVDAAMETPLPTGVLNNTLRKLTDRQPARVVGGRRFKIYYATQVATRPVTIKFFCNRAEQLEDGYRRYLDAGLRQSFDLRGCPMRFELVGKTADNPYHTVDTSGKDKRAVNTLSKHGKARPKENRRGGKRSR